MITSFQVSKDSLRAYCWQVLPKPERLGQGEVLIAIERIGFTSNNITYARLGGQIRYWSFFPAEGGWGRIPVWGIGKVEETNHPDLAAGESIYGYFPMDSHVILQPGPPSGARIYDLSPHRSELPPTYNEYVLVDRAPGYEPPQIDAQLTLRPLFSLSFFSAAFLAGHDDFGAEQIIMTSASSKAALGLAHELKRRAPGRSRPRVIGLTSPANEQFVRGLSVHDAVFTYDGVEQLPARKSVLVDVGGSARTRRAVHEHLGSLLAYSMLAGFTHEDATRNAEEQLPGPKPELFFTPAHILRLRKEWGADLLRTRLAEAWASFLAFTRQWLSYEHIQSRPAIERAYIEVLEGRIAPDKALLFTIPTD